jgi:hypothetical protein
VAVETSDGRDVGGERVGVVVLEFVTGGVVVAIGDRAVAGAEGGGALL